MKRLCSSGVLIFDEIEEEIAFSSPFLRAFFEVEGLARAKSVQFLATRWSEVAVVSQLKVTPRRGLVHIVFDSLEAVMGSLLSASD